MDRLTSLFSSTTLRSSLGEKKSPAVLAAGAATIVGASYLAYRMLQRNRKYLESLVRIEYREEKTLKHVLATATEGDVDSVIDTIDRWCHDGNWMMNVGDKKGALLDVEIIRNQPKVVLELGAYCGYSALRIAKLLPPGGHLYSIEINALNAAIATKIIEFAGLKDRVTFIVGTVDTRLAVVQAKYKIAKFDLVFIDHFKAAYLSDLLTLEKAGAVQSGTVLVADNCLFPGCPDYVQYVSTSPDYVSVCHETELEYKPDVVDHVWVSTRK